jgi:predicted amidohydrolase YtcJ
MRQKIIRQFDCRLTSGRRRLRFTNGKIYAVDTDMPWAEAVAVKGKEIVFFGNNAGEQAFVGKSTCKPPLE